MENRGLKTDNKAKYRDNRIGICLSVFYIFLFLKIPRSEYTGSSVTWWGVTWVPALGADSEGAPEWQPLGRLYYSTCLGACTKAATAHAQSSLHKKVGATSLPRHQNLKLCLCHRAFLSCSFHYTSKMPMEKLY